jgi:hypothetical protein
VPVTTVPAPRIVKTRSTNSRVRASAGGGAAASIASRAARISSRPSPVADETGTIGAACSAVPSSRRRTSAVAAARRSSSTRSRFVRATTASATPSTSRIWRCSSLCGFHPSSAATTNSTSGTGPTPASMFAMNRSWPGTSTNPTSRPLGSVHQA